MKNANRPMSIEAVTSLEYKSAILVECVFYVLWSRRKTVSETADRTERLHMIIGSEKEFICEMVIA